MCMPLYAWAAYIDKAAAYQTVDTLNQVLAASFPHMEKADRIKTLNDLRSPLVLTAPAITKEEYVAQMSMAGINVELN